MAGDHKCPVCQATFTRPQHVARHMRSHTGDRPYKCQHCGDQFARSDLLSRHINKCHANEKPPTTSNTRRKGAASACRATTSKQACDQCVQSSLPCDGANPCSKCIHRKCRCTYVKFHRQTAPQGPGHPSRPNDPNSLAPNLNALPSIPASFRLSDSFLLGPSAPAAPQPGAQGNTLYNHQFNFPPGTQLYSGTASGLDGSGLHLPGANLNRDSFENVADYSARYRAQADLLSRQGMIPSATELANGRSGSVGHAGMYADMQQHQPSQNPRYTGQQYGIQNDPSYPPNYDDNKLFPREGSEHYMPSQQLSNYGVNSGDTFNQSGVPISYIAEHRPRHLQHQPHRRGSTSLASDGGSSTSASQSQPSSAASSSVHLPISTDYQQQQHHGFPVDYAPSPVDGQRPPSHHGHPQQGQHPPQGDGEGGFSSAFGLMSLDDPNVLAGLTQGAPFFEHAMENGGSWSGDGITPRPGPTQSSHHEGNKDGNGNLPAATPSSLKELKEMWKQYMRTPFAGPLATPLAHTTSDQLAAAGGGLDPSLPRGSPKKERGLTRVASLPSVKTPDANNANGGGVGLRSLYNPEDLRSYEAAVLARKTPLNLNLQARRRGTLASVSMSGSGGAGSGSGSSDGKSTSASPQHQPNAAAMVAMGLPMPSQLVAMNVSRPSSSSSTSSLAHAFGVSSDGRSSESPAPGAYAHAPSPVMPPHTHGLPADGERDMRPSFKRLPSQTLVPDYSKRAAVHQQYSVQHLRGGGDDSALDERDGEDRVGGPMGPPPVAGYAQRMSEACAGEPGARAADERAGGRRACVRSLELCGACDILSPPSGA